ncbi:MAG: DUF222 domain-containing protein, partial [Acidimicrobiales bacterium]
MTIKKRMGHSTIQITFDRYGHLFPELDEVVADGLDVTFRKARADHRPATVNVVELNGRSQAEENAKRTRERGENAKYGSPAVDGGPDPNRGTTSGSLLHPSGPGMFIMAVTPPPYGWCMGGEQTFETIDGAASSLEAMVNALDVATLSGPGAARLAKRLVTCERVLAACRAEAVKRAADANQWRTAGERSPGAWAAKVTGTTLGQANAELETTAKLEHLPATAAARASGELSELQAKEIAGAATADPAAEAELLRRAKVDDAAALKRRCAAVRAAAEADEAAAREEIRKERRFKWWTDAEGAFCFSGRGLAEDGAALLAAMKRYQDRAFHTARRAGAHEPSQAYAYDALMAMARHDAAHQCAPATSGAGTTGTAPPTGSTPNSGTTGSTGSTGSGATAGTTGTAPPTGSTPNTGSTGSTGSPGSGATAGTTGATPDTNGRSATSTTEEPGGRAGPSTTTGTPTVPRHAGDPPGSTPTDTSRRNGAAGRATTCASTATLFDTPAQAGTEATGARAGPEPPDIDADRDEILAECFKPGPGPKFIV